MEVTINEPRIAAKKLLDHLADSGHTKVSLENDYYWFISKADRYNVYRQPSEWTIGQLSDDWNELKQIGEGTSRTSCLRTCLALVGSHSGW